MQLLRTMATFAFDSNKQETNMTPPRSGRRQLVLGGWIAVTVGIASFAGGAHLYLAMAVLGGGGFAVAAVAAARDRAGRP